MRRPWGGPGQHFLGCAHTQANFETAFYRSTVADNNSFEQWQAEGALDTASRTNVIWKKTLADYQARRLRVSGGVLIAPIMANHAGHASALEALCPLPGTDRPLSRKTRSDPAENVESQPVARTTR